MKNCGCHVTSKTLTERKILRIALALNATMFVIGLIAGVFAQSTSLIADSFDMLADASAYTIGLLAINCSPRFKALAASFSGGLLLILGIVVMIEVIRRIWVDSIPESTTIMVVACISLIVNTCVLRMLSQFRQGEVHLRATWLFTRADIVVNIGVILSGAMVAITKSRYPDLIIGCLVGLFVIKEAYVILQSARHQ